MCGMPEMPSLLSSQSKIENQKSEIPACLAALALLLAAGCGSSKSPEEQRVAALCEQLRDHDAPTRLAAAKELAQLKPKAAAEHLIRSLYDIRTDVRLAAIEALGEIADPAATEPLIACLREEGWALRKAAAEALAKLADPKAIPRLIESLADADRSVALAAATTLGALGPTALQPLLASLRQSTPSSPPTPNTQHPTPSSFARTREGLAHALGYLGDRRAAAPLRALLADPAPMVRLAAADALCRLADAPSVAPIAALMKDPDETVRRGVRHALVRLGPLALPALEAAVKDARRDVRLAALAALANISDPGATAPLLIAATDIDRDVAGAAAKTLRSRFPPKQPLTPLIEALKHPEASVRLEALGLLSDLAFPRGAAKPARDLSDAVEPLLGALRDADPKLRARAAGLLGRLGAERAVAPLAAALADPDPAVALAAAQAVAATSNPQAVNALLATLREPTTSPPPTPNTKHPTPPSYARLCVAIEALGKSRDKRAFDPLLDLLPHPDLNARQ
ncbi:MAG: HEAT repeat domain-containing protein, partial [Planctomycetes bacterium]|nr:HEAT repeat domain-containing protein [Planctomycetota bacterium]